MDDSVIGKLVETVRNQIRNKLNGSMLYKNEKRWYSPHMIGVTKDRRIVIHAYQYQTTDQEAKPGWRFFYLHEIEGLMVETCPPLSPWYPLGQPLDKAEKKEYTPPKFVIEVLEVVQ